MPSRLMRIFSVLIKMEAHPIEVVLVPFRPKECGNGHKYNDEYPQYDQYNVVVTEDARLVSWYCC